MAGMNGGQAPPKPSEFMDALFRGLPGLAYVFDDTGHFVLWNSGYQRLLGLSDEDMRNLSALDIVVPRDRERIGAAMAGVLTGNEVALECSLGHGGREIAIYGTGILVHLGGKPYIVGTAVDVSDRLAAEAALARSERNYREIFNAATDAMVIHGEGGVVSDINERTTTLFGWVREDVIGKSPDQFIFEEPPYSRSEALEKLRLAFDVGPQLFEWPCKRANGELFWSEVALRASLIAGENRVITAVRDISERKHVEASLRASEAKFRRLFDGGADAIFIHDQKGRIVDVNKAACRSLGYLREELLGLPVTAFEDGVDAQHMDALWSAVAQGATPTLEGLHRRKDGTTFPVEVRLIPFTHEDQPLVFAAVRDISERKRAEAERYVLEESLRQAQKMESVGRLAGGIAHDFNNLLTAISGNLSLLLLGDSSEAATVEMLKEAAQAAESAANLTRQLLAFSRKQVIRPKVMCLNDVVSGMQKMLCRLVGEDVELRIKLDPDLGQAEIDQGQVEQVLVNLVVNARDAMPNGGTLVVETANMPEESGHQRQVMVIVSDDGIGMGVEVKKHLFEPFFTTKEVGKGTGLGLAMVYGAVTQNHGRIDVTSEPGRGTTFRMYFPRVDTPVDQLSERVALFQQSGKETIMVVEDEAQVRSLATRILQRQGYQVLAYESGDLAFAALEKMNHVVDLLLTDIVMPGMNGRALAEKALRLRPTLKVLFTSGYTQDVIAHHGVLDLGVEFIAKPYSVDGLAEHVRKILDTAKTSGRG